jgi:hypothetical protein
MNKKPNGAQNKLTQMDFADLSQDFAIHNLAGDAGDQPDDDDIADALSPDPGCGSTHDENNRSDTFAVDTPWHENDRAAPSEFLRSALFSPNRRANQLIVGERLPTNKPTELIVWGDSRTQFDLDLWMAVVHLARFGKPVRVTAPQLLKVAGRSPGGSTEARVRESLELLGCYTVRLTVKARTRNSGLSVPKPAYTFSGHLIERLSWEPSAGRWDFANIGLHPNLAELFRPQRRTHIPARARSQLGDKPLAQWMYAFFRTHHTVLPLPVSYYQKLSGAESSMSDFRARLKKAMTLLAAESLIHSASLREGRLFVQRNKPLMESTYPDAEWTVRSQTARKIPAKGVSK